MIFSNLTVIELGRAQQTYKRWCYIAQKNSILWEDATAFFTQFNPRYTIFNIGNARTPLYDKRRIKVDRDGFKKLLELSKGNLDGILIDSNNQFCGTIMKALKEQPPTRLAMNFLDLCYLTEGRCTQCLEYLAKVQTLKHLNLNLFTISGLWKLELSCSLESLELHCPHLSKCGDKGSMIQAFKSVKKLKLYLPFEHPGHLDFLDKIGQSLESLELNEENRLKDFGLRREFREDEFPQQATGQNTKPNLMQRTKICVPNLLSLTVESKTNISNQSYELNCPRLQSLTVTGDLSVIMIEGRGKSIYELLDSTETISYVSIDLRFSVNTKPCLERFFSKFRYIKELKIRLSCHAGLKSLVDTLPETVSLLVVNLSSREKNSEELSDRLSETYRDGGTIERTGKYDNLISKLDVVIWGKHADEDIYYDLTILGRANLQALAFGRGG